MKLLHQRSGEATSPPSQRDHRLITTPFCCQFGPHTTLPFSQVLQPAIINVLQACQAIKIFLSLVPIQKAKQRSSRL